MRARSIWTRFVAVTLLLYAGAGLISIVLPEEPQPSGYYDGDGDDAAATPERSPDLVHGAVAGRPASLPVPTSAPAALLASPASPPAPGRSQPPPLRSPPA